jgi:hypothetical protein
MKPWLRIYCLLAGSADGATGLLLLAAPGFVFARLGLGPLPAPPVYASFVGAFVLAVGVSYLYPLALGVAGLAARWRQLFETTAISRLAVALFLAAAIGTGRLGPAWGLVLATDLGLAFFQLYRLRLAAAEAKQR